MMNVGPSKDRKPSVPLVSAASICDQIRSLIVGGKIPLGGRIHDKTIAQELGVSRTPVREALLQLQNEGLVIIKPQSGTFVFSLTESDLHHICAARAVFETGAVRIGLAGARSDVFAEVSTLVSRAALALKDGDLALCDELDWMFHESLVASTGNKFLIRAYTGISAQLRALRHHLPRDPDRVRRSIDQHRRILDLCAAERTDDAVAELDAHVTNVKHLLMRVDGLVIN